MNETIECLKTRRSVRKYTDEAVKESDITEILEAAVNAPTGKGKQSPRIVVIRSKELIAALSAMNAKVLGADTDPFYGASTLMVVFADTEVPTYINDGSLVIGNILNAAHSLGLGSCWIHRARQVFSSPEGQKLMQEWGIPSTYEGIGHVILGYADGAPQEAAPRKKDYVTWVK